VAAYANAEPQIAAAWSSNITNWGQSKILIERARREGLVCANLLDRKWQYLHEPASLYRHPS
jgi:hypothetical protein